MNFIDLWIDSPYYYTVFLHHLSLTSFIHSSSFVTHVDYHISPFFYRSQSLFAHTLFFSLCTLYYPLLLQSTLALLNYSSGTQRNGCYLLSKYSDKSCVTVDPDFFFLCQIMERRYVQRNGKRFTRTVMFKITEQTQ